MISDDIYNSIFTCLTSDGRSAWKDGFSSLNPADYNLKVSTGDECFDTLKAHSHASKLKHFSTNDVSSVLSMLSKHQGKYVNFVVGSGSDIVVMCYFNKSFTSCLGFLSFEPYLKPECESNEEMRILGNSENE